MKNTKKLLPACFMSKTKRGFNVSDKLLRKDTSRQPNRNRPVQSPKLAHLLTKIVIRRELRHQEATKRLVFFAKRFNVEVKEV